MLSVIIPNRNSQFTSKTVDDLLEKAVGEIEIIVNVDEKWPEPLSEDKRVTYIHPAQPVGMRGGINNGLRVAKGKYIMKTDDHCLFAPGFDKALADDHEDNWLVIPRRYSLDAENWAIEQNNKGPRDYHYLCFPKQGKEHDWGMHGVEWPQRVKERSDPKYDIDETPAFQGSCWFANREYFMKHVGFMDDRIETYSTFAQEPQEIGLKYWLGGDKVMVNKKTYYAHLHKGKRYGRMYSVDYHTVASHNWSARHWMNNEEPGMKYTMEWFVTEKFPNMPTWEPNWKQELIDTGLITNI